MTIKNIPADSAAAIKVGGEVELGFSDLLANGQAVGRSGGLVVFCFGPLPEERARVRISAIKPKYAVANLIELTVRSPLRAQPFCPVFGICGGCQIQHLAYPAQLRWKAEVVRNALLRIGGFNGASVREPIGMTNPRAYRNKMSLVVSDGSILGFYKQRSHDLVPIDACPIVMPELDAHIGKLAGMLTQPELKSVFSDTRHIVERAAKASGQSVVTFTTRASSPELRRHAAAIADQLRGAVGVTNSFDPSSENAILGQKHAVVAGAAQIEETIGGVRYRVSAGSFFQVNVEIVARILDFVRPGLNVPRKIVDLYCGAGTFSLYFAKLGCRVVGVEENAQAIAEARENAGLNDLKGSVKFIRAKVEDAVRHGEARAALKDAEVVFLDPPRKGSDEVTLGAIADSGVPNVWYLSCDPATLSRDLKFLAAKGYILGAVQPFDMFPQTGHVETLVTMRRQSTGDNLEL